MFLVGCYSWLHIPEGKGIVLWSLKSRNLWIQLHVLVVMMLMMMMLLMVVVFFRNTAAVWNLTQQMRMLLFQKISIRSSVGYP
jgi:formate hydrogenlyase subunit 4